MKVARALLIFGAALALGGCASAQIAPYKAAVKGMADTGDALDPDCLIANPTAGQKALLDAWRTQRRAARALVEVGE